MRSSTDNMSWATSSPGMAISREPQGADKEKGADDPTPTEKRKKVVVIGLGMVGIAFM